MKQFIQLGTAPPDEDCAQLGSDNYQERARIEASIHIEQLNRFFKRKPKGFSFGIKRFNHDFGEYIDIVLYYADDEAERAYTLQEKQPKVWDTIAIEQLRTNEYQMSAENITAIYSNTNTELRDAIDKIEKAGGFVILDEEDEENEEPDFSEDGDIIEPEDIAKPETSAISVDEAFRMHGYDLDNDSDIAKLFMESVVPACCKYGCEVEPDGECIHGNISVITAMI